jgi:predicted nucleic-acid-binding protein
VLRSRAKLDKAQILLVFKRLLEAQDLQIAGEQVLEHALYSWENSRADFAGCLFVADYLRMGCRAVPSFDRAAAELAGVELL